MVVNMLKWRPWPPLPSKKFEATIVVCRVEGLCESSEKRSTSEDLSRLGVEIKWKGSKGNGLSYLRRRQRRNYSKEERLREDGIVEWNEEFRSVCRFPVYKEGSFHPWHVTFTLFNGLNERPINKLLAVATASLDLAEFAAVNEAEELQVSIPLAVPAGSINYTPWLCLSLCFRELRSQVPSEMVQRSIASLPVPPRTEDGLSTEKYEVSALRAGLRKVKALTGYVTAEKAKNVHREEEGSDGRSSVKSDDAECTYPLDTDSLDEVGEGESEEGREDPSVQQSVGYGSLAHANFVGASFYSNSSNSEDEDWIYYNKNRSDAGFLHAITASIPDQSLRQSSKRSILPWRKRKLSFRSPKDKGEPLLRKDYREEGGDDIDFDRRQLSSSDESSYRGHKTGEDSTANRSSFSEFGDENFSVGSWENKEVTSRDGHMKLQTQVFFASIDQRSERAAGESACTALVAIIADWFHSNPYHMPIKSQLDSLIREGSIEWRNLCNRTTYREKFPDKHFDLETVLQAEIHPLCVVPEKSFVGFFHPKGVEEMEGFDFLHGAMSFDSIWEEISQSGSENASNGDPLVYIVSWNDHFFILKVEQDSYYIVDTLGESLYEGCNQAYVLKFDKDTTIKQLPQLTQSSDEKLASEKVQSHNPKEDSSEGTEVVVSNESGISEDELVVCRGKETCKEYIKSFLAAIPIRELQDDLKKGLMASTPLHHRLQIEFHYTHHLQPAAKFSSIGATADEPAISATEVV